MSKVAAACLLISCVFAVDDCSGRDCDEVDDNEVLLLQARVNHRTSEEHKQQLKQSPDLGKSACPCVGIGNVPGNLNVTVGGEIFDQYPREMAASCKAWDEGLYPGSCTGETPASWCSSKWCYVDPCECDADAIGDSPKKSTYFPNGMYKGHELYYSYVTCDGTDTYSDAEVAQKDKDKIASICEAPVDEEIYGNSSCPCIGVSGRAGKTQVNISGTPYTYPGDYGTYCSGHDSGLAPDCDSEAPPSWCVSKWCYVDPCDCNILPLPKYTSYIAGGLVKGHEVYYSYATCSSTDTYTAADKITADQAAIPGICNSTA